ncbi:hypothetical protein CLU79DRAFT_738335 [Phycomyces nitens]|nr:hypothetical protein CLU79DRAFT_738335 [Phycomyces nitens]
MFKPCVTYRLGQSLQEMHVCKEDVNPLFPIHARNQSILEYQCSFENKDSSEQTSSPITCQCGKPLESGWDCENCRRNCSHCNRALTTDPEDYCTRCYRYCSTHGAYSIIASPPVGDSSSKTCPSCIDG